MQFYDEFISQLDMAIFSNLFVFHYNIDYINQHLFVLSFANCYRAGVLSLKVFLSIT